MKKCMFNDKFGLTGAVLAELKTMTRREDKKLNHPLVTDISDWGIDEKGKAYVSITYSTGLNENVYPAYQPGEEVAVAQSYKSIVEQDPTNDYGNYYIKQFRYTPGWTNKMFVKANFMPHRICITNIKFERLQDISEEDAMREGVFKYDKPPLHHEYDMFAPWPPYVKPYKYDIDNLKYFSKARFAFACLIDKISGKGTWKRNPWVFAYEFKLID